MRRAECWATRLQVENHFSTKGVHSDVLGLGGKLGGFDLSGETAWCEWGNTGHGGQPSCPTQTMSASLSKKGDSRLLQDCPTEDVMSIQWGNGFKIAVRDFYFKLIKLSWFLLFGVGTTWRNGLFSFSQKHWKHGLQLLQTTFRSHVLGDLWAINAHEEWYDNAPVTAIVSIKAFKFNSHQLKNPSDIFS